MAVRTVKNEIEITVSRLFGVEDRGDETSLICHRGSCGASERRSCQRYQRLRRFNDKGSGITVLNPVTRPRFSKCSPKSCARLKTPDVFA